MCNTLIEPVIDVADIDNGTITVHDLIKHWHVYGKVTLKGTSDEIDRVEKAYKQALAKHPD